VGRSPAAGRVDGELVPGIRTALAGVPGGAAAHRADETDLMLGPQSQQTRRRRLAGVHQVLGREQVPVGEHGMDRHGHRGVGDGGVGGDDVGGDDVGELLE